MQFFSYTHLSGTEIFQTLKTRPEGLLTHEVTKRREEFGYNEITTKKFRAWYIFFRQFRSAFVLLLFGAAGTAFVLSEWIDGSMILLFVVVNVFLGFYQEYRSEKSLELLGKYMVARARVLRGGKEFLLESRELVPGDIIITGEGDILPADIRFFDTNQLMIDESVLTGESISVLKTSVSIQTEIHEIHKASNIGFSGTTVVDGSGMGVVFATGIQTQMGEASQMTLETIRESSFEKGIRRFSVFTLRLIFLTLVVVFFANLLLKKDSFGIGEFLIFSIALAVSVIPEALPLVATISLSRGSLRLAKKHVVVKRLSAIEDLGSIEVLCTDKTGTLTENRLKVQKIKTLSPYHESQCLFFATLAASFLGDGKKEPNNAFDLALLKNLSRKDREKLSRLKRISELSFDPERRRNSVIVEERNRRQLIVRGAFDVILKLSNNLSDDERQDMIQWVKEEGKLGRRVIAIAILEMKKEENLPKAHFRKNLQYVGAVSFRDPLKSSTKKAVDEARRLGIRVKMLTGDAREVAGAVAFEMGLIGNPEDVLTGEEFEKLEEAKQHEAVLNFQAFARVTPAQKYRIIHLLEEHSDVGFLGEGINDAPALKIAHVALVVNDASELAREAADIVLLEKSLHVIIEGVKEGRKIFSNTIKYIEATLVSNFGNFYAVAIASLIIDFFPMLPLQLLLVNLLSDFPMMAIATDTVDSHELHRPRNYDVKEVVSLATTLGLVSTVFDFIFFALFYRISPEVLQTNWFVGSILTELLLIFSIRTKLPFYRAKRASGILISLSLLAALLTLLIPFTPLGKNIFHFVSPRGEHLLWILGIVLCYFLTTEFVKLFYFRAASHQIHAH